MSEIYTENKENNSTPITISAEFTSNSISDHKDLNISNSKSFTIYAKYHESEIIQNQKICDTARRIIWAGFFVIIVGIVLSFSGKVTPALIASITGTIIEFISSIIFIFLTKSSKSKLEYYKELSFDEECNKYLNAANTIEEKDRVPLINKLADNYCQRRK